MSSLTLGAGTHTFGTLTINLGDDVTMDATSGNVTLLVDTITNNAADSNTEGLLMINNATNECIISRNTSAASTYITYSGPQPKANTSNGNVTYGVFGSRLGPDFPEGTDYVTDDGSGSSIIVNIKNDTRFRDLLINTNDTMDILPVDLVFGSNSGTNVFSALGTISIDAGTVYLFEDDTDVNLSSISAANINSLTINTGVTVQFVSGLDVFMTTDGVLTINSSAVLDLSVDLTLNQDAVVNYVNSGIIQGSGDLILLEASTTFTSGTVNCASLIMQADGLGSETITLGANLTLSDSTDLVVESLHGSFTMTLDTSISNYSINCGAFTINTRGIVAFNDSTIDINGNWNSASGSFSGGAWTLIENSGGTITTDGTSGQAFETIEINGGFTTTLGSDLYIDNFIDFNSNVGTLDFATFDITLTKTSANPWIASTGITMTASNASSGRVIYEATAASTVDISGDYHTLLIRSTNGTVNAIASAGNIDCVEDFNLLDSGANSVSVNMQAVDLTVGDALTIPSSATLSMDGRDVSLGGQLLSATTITVAGTLTLDTGAGVNDRINITCTTLTTNSGSSFTYDVSGATSATSTFSVTNLNINVGSTVDFDGNNTNQLQINTDDIQIIGDVTSLTWDEVNVVATFVAFKISAVQTGTFTVTDCDFQSTDGSQPPLSIEAAWTTNNEGTNFVRSSFDGALTGIDARLTAAAVVVMKDCDLVNLSAEIQVSGGMIWLYGTDITGGGFDLNRVWGQAIIGGGSSDIGTAVLNDIPNGALELKNDAGATNHADVTAAVSISPTSVSSDSGNTQLTVDTGTTLTIVDTAGQPTAHSIGIFTIDGSFVYSPTVNNNTTLTMQGDVTTGTTPEWTTDASGVTGTQILLEPGVDLEFVDSPGCTFNNHTIEKTGAGDNPSLRVAGTTISTFTDIDFITLGRNVGGSEPRRAAIRIGGSGSTTTVDGCTLTSCLEGIGFENNVSVTSTIVSNSVFTNCTTGIGGQTGDTNIEFDRCQISGGTNGISWAFFDFNGKMRGVSVFDATRSLFIQSGDVSPGSMIDCVFQGGSEDVRTSSGNVHLVNSYLSATPSITHVNSSDYLVSWQHERTNTKEVLISGPIVVDSSFESVVNADTFDWNWVGGEWDINNGDNRFESASATTLDGMKSDFIPCLPNTTYFIRYRGDVSTVKLRQFQSDQVTQNSATLSWTASGDDFIATITTDSSPDTVWFQWNLTASAVGEQFYDAEIRETNSTGNVIWNEDLVNNYEWLSTDIDYGSGFRLQVSGVGQDLVFGDVEYDQLDMEISVDGYNNVGDQAGVYVGWQDANNYYRIYADRDTGKARFDKVVSGTPTNIDTATISGPVSFDLRVTWNNVANAVEVYQDGSIATWDGSGITSSTTDATYTQGRAAIFGTSVFIDDLIVKQFGFFLRDIDLNVQSGATITVSAGGEFSYKRGSVNATRAIVQTEGYPNPEEEVVWLDDSFDETITAVTNLVCGKAEVTTDVIIETLGQLVATGSVFLHQDKTQYWTIQTELSTVEPPMIIKSCLFKNLNTRFRPHDTADGAPYEIDQTKEFIMDSPEPTHSPHVISHSIWGRARHRNIIKGFTDEQVTLNFRARTFDDNCLYGKARQWMDDEALLEVIWPRGYIWKCKIVDMVGGEITPGMNMIEFVIRLQEFR